LGPPAAAQDPAPSWIIPDLAVAARAEGSLTIYSSMNEQEGLPLWKMFEAASGVTVNYVRSSDSIILSRIAIEHRARQRSWDIAVTTTHTRGARSQPALVRRLCQLQHAGLQYRPGEEVRPAEEL
jgi:hypothetical protein